MDVLFPFFKLFVFFKLCHLNCWKKVKEGDTGEINTDKKESLWREKNKKKKPNRKWEMR